MCRQLLSLFHSFTRQVYWPDFQHDAMRAALADFARRQRRFGKTSDQVEAEARS